MSKWVARLDVTLDLKSLIYGLYYTSKNNDNIGITATAEFIREAIKSGAEAATWIPVYHEVSVERVNRLVSEVNWNNFEPQSCVLFEDGSIKLMGLHSESIFSPTKVWIDKTKPSASELSKRLPGTGRYVINPVTGIAATLYYVIINLNDVQKWTREQIADWLETLDIDLRFNVETT